MTNRSSTEVSTDQASQWKPPRDFQFGEAFKAILVALIFTVPFVAVGGGIMYGDYVRWETSRLATEQRMQSLDVLLSAPPQPVLPAEAVHRGRQLYATTCAACHSPTGAGVPGLGKDLLRSWFMASLDDDGLQEFLRVGRAADAPENTTGVLMPGRGGQDLSDEDLGAVVAYMRTLQDPRRMPDATAMAEAEAAAPEPEASEEDSARFLAVADGDEDLAYFIANGSKLYASTCAACHGKDGAGVQGSGVALRGNRFCEEQDDEELLAFIKRGRDPGDPANTTGIGMPARGGNPALDDDDLLDIIAYVRALEQLTASR